MIIPYLSIRIWLVYRICTIARYTMGRGNLFFIPAELLQYLQQFPDIFHSAAPAEAYPNGTGGKTADGLMGKRCAMVSAADTDAV